MKTKRYVLFAAALALLSFTHWIAYSADKLDDAKPAITDDTDAQPVKPSRRSLPRKERRDGEKERQQEGIFRLATPPAPRTVERLPAVTKVSVTVNGQPVETDRRNATTESRRDAETGDRFPRLASAWEFLTRLPILRRLER